MSKFGFIFRAPADGITLSQSSPLPLGHFGVLPQLSTLSMSASHAYSQIANGHGNGNHSTTPQSIASAMHILESNDVRSVTAASTVTIDVASLRPTSRTSASLDVSSDSEDDLTTVATEMNETLTDEDRRLFNSLPKPGFAGRLRPRSRRTARLYYYLNRCLDAMPYALDAGMRGLGPALIVTAWILFFTCAFVFFYAIVPCHGWSVTTWPGCFTIPYGLWLLFQVYSNHILACFVKPGALPKDYPIPADIVNLITVERETLVKGESFSKYCKQCIKPKVPRMHHCHVCGTCVARMDHHCPWIGGCVGFFNYRYFYNFLFWLEVGCIFLVCCTLPLVAWPTEEQFIRMYQKHPDWMFLRLEGPVFFILVLTGAAALAVGGMLTLHTYLVLTNQTTIEMYFNSKKSKQAKRRGEEWFNPYDLGWKRNWLSVLGAAPGGWMITSLFPKPFGMAELDGSGLQYELNPKMSVDYYSAMRQEVVLTI